jgi:hypothetical protein
MSNINATPIIKSVDALLKEVVFICYEPNKLDAHGEWMSVETLYKACADFNRFLSEGTVVPNLFHMKDEDDVAEPTDAFDIIKSWVSPTDCIIGETFVEEGTWLVKVKFKNDQLWELFEKGKVRGVSIGATGKVGK